MADETQNITSSGRAIWAFVRVVGPVILSAAVGWGSVQFAQGTTTTKISNLESTVTANKAEAQGEAKEIRDTMIRREEFQLLISTVGEIRTDVREIRAAQSKSR